MILTASLTATLSEASHQPPEEKLPDSVHKPPLKMKQVLLIEKPLHKKKLPPVEKPLHHGHHPGKLQGAIDWHNQSIPVPKLTAHRPSISESKPPKVEKPQKPPFHGHHPGNPHMKDVKYMLKSKPLQMMRPLLVPYERPVHKKLHLSTSAIHQHQFG
uniref:Uncharacterized protein n=1 Tax=Nelumbo nucifera TaxID=4432 RepID=A0A822YZR4_NELNU|nr:TPA_asm: hypothetical protein HUJ06_007400 [Nelumbo nucifera]